MKLSGVLAERGLHAFDKEPHTHAGNAIPRIWIVVADRVRAHIFRKTAQGMDHIATAVPAGGSGDADKGGSGFHGYDVGSANTHHGDGAFIQKLSAWLDEAEREKAFDRLVLVAAPRTLGDLRTAVSKNVHMRIAAEVAKELTEMPEPDIKKHLADIVWF